MGEGDSRFAAATLLDRRFDEHPHLSGKINAARDYEVHCNECGTIDTYSFSGKNEVDAQTFALSVTETSPPQIGRLASATFILSLMTHNRSSIR